MLALDFLRDRLGARWLLRLGVSSVQTARPKKKPFVRSLLTARRGVDTVGVLCYISNRRTVSLLALGRSLLTARLGKLGKWSANRKWWRIDKFVIRSKNMILNIQKIKQVYHLALDVPTGDNCSIVEGGREDFLTSLIFLVYYRV